MSDYGMMMFPNLVSKVLNVKFSVENWGRNLNIYSETGQIIRRSKIKIEETQLNISERSNGLYFVKYSRGSFSYSGKFVKVSGKSSDYPKIQISTAH